MHGLWRDEVVGVAGTLRLRATIEERSRDAALVAGQALRAARTEQGADLREQGELEEAQRGVGAGFKAVEEGGGRNEG